MKISEIKQLIELCTVLLPSQFQGQLLSREKVEQIKKESQDRVGEFTTKLCASDCLLLMDMQAACKAKIEEAELNGRDEI